MIHPVASDLHDLIDSVNTNKMFEPFNLHFEASKKKHDKNFVIKNYMTPFIQSVLQPYGNFVLEKDQKSLFILQIMTHLLNLLTKF